MGADVCVIKKYFMENIFVIIFTALATFSIGFIASRLFFLNRIQRLGTEKAVFEKETNMVRVELTNTQENLLTESEKSTKSMTELADKNARLDGLNRQL